VELKIRLSEMPKTSIVIRCFNEEKQIGRLLSGIMQQTIQDVEIILVDSGSTDATVSIASCYPVKILSITPEEFSFGRSLNLGCQASQGDLIVIPSGHVYPLHKDWLEKLIAPFEDPEIALTYGKQRGNEVTKYSEHQVFAKWFPEESNLKQTHPFCNNANAAIRRSLWEQIPYDETLTGLEDLNWAKKVLQLGYCIAYVADAEIIHVHNETPKKIFNRYRREAITFKRIFPQEHFHLWDFTCLFITNVVNDYYHAWHDNVLRQNLLAIPTFRLMQFWGTYRGFSQHGPITSQMKQTFYYPRGLKRQSSVSTEDRGNKLIEYNNQLPGELSQFCKNKEVSSNKE
jgi:glycosyltransferase involved in cell wall biosynthesis